MIIANIILTILYSIFAIIYKKGVPESISETSSFWPNSKLNIFTCYCIITGLFLFYPWISSGSYEFLAFLGIAGLFVAGSTPLFKEESFQNRLHYIGGILSEICSVLWMILNGYWLFISIAFSLAIILTIFKPKSWVFFFEIFTMLCLYIVLLI